MTNRLRLALAQRAGLHPTDQPAGVVLAVCERRGLLDALERGDVVPLEESHGLYSQLDFERMREGR